MLERITETIVISLLMYCAVAVVTTKQSSILNFQGPLPGTKPWFSEIHCFNIYTGSHHAIQTA